MKWSFRETFSPSKEGFIHDQSSMECRRAHCCQLFGWVLVHLYIYIYIYILKLQLLVYSMNFFKRNSSTFLLLGWRLKRQTNGKFRQSWSVARSKCWTTVSIGTVSLSVYVADVNSTSNNQSWKEDCFGFPTRVHPNLPGLMLNSLHANYVLRGESP